MRADLFAVPSDYANEKSEVFEMLFEYLPRAVNIKKAGNTHGSEIKSDRASVPRERG